MSWSKADLARVRKFARDEDDLRALMEMPVVEREEELERRHTKFVWSSGRALTISQRPGPTQLDLGIGEEDRLSKDESDSFIDEEEDEESEPDMDLMSLKPMEPQISATCYQNVILPAQFLVIHSPQWFFEELIQKHAMFLLRLEPLGSNILPQYSRDLLIPVRVSPDIWQTDSNSPQEIYKESREHICDSYLANPDISRYYVDITFPEELQKKRVRVSCADLVQDEHQYNEAVPAATLFTDTILKQVMDPDKCLYKEYKAITYTSLIESHMAIRAVLNSIIGNKPERDYVSRLVQFEQYIIGALSPLPNIRINQIHMRIDAIVDNEKQILLDNHVNITEVPQEELEERYSETSKRHLKKLREELANCKNLYRKYLTSKKDMPRVLYNTTMGVQANVEFACFNKAGALRQRWQKRFDELSEVHAGDQYEKRLASLRKQLGMDMAQREHTSIGKAMLFTETVDNFALDSTVTINDGFFVIDAHEDLGAWPLLGPRYRVDILGDYSEDAVPNGRFHFCHRYSENNVIVFKFARQPVDMAV